MFYSLIWMGFFLNCPDLFWPKGHKFTPVYLYQYPVILYMYMYILVHTFLVLYFIAKEVSTGSKFSSIFPYQLFIFLCRVGFNCMFICIHADTEHNIVIMVSLILVICQPMNGDCKHSICFCWQIVYWIEKPLHFKCFIFSF